MERLQNFKSTERHVDILFAEEAVATKMRKEKEREENREIVRSIFDVVRHLAKQNSAFRGHDESTTSANSGNFMEELKFIAKFHKPLADWMENHPQNLSYFSPDIQNEMIEILSGLILESIKSEVISAKYYSIECDEVTSHKRAFMSIIVRYVYDYTIWERCIKLERVTSLTGKSLADIIVKTLTDMKFPIKNLVGKGFDGASNMSGKDEGVQEHITKAGASKSVYFHCFAHRLNLVLEKSVNSVTVVNDVFDIIGSIYRYLEGSPKRHALYEEKLRTYSISTGKKALHTLSDTRWTARSDNLNVVLNTLPAIISMLQHMSGEGESAAGGLLLQLQRLKFIASCMVLKKCFSLSRSVSEYLQHEDMDLVSAVSGVQSLKTALSSLRNEETMELFLTEAQDYCTQHKLDVNDFGDNPGYTHAPKRQRTMPAYLNDGSFYLDQDASAIQNARNTDADCREAFKRDFFFSFLDWLLNELEKRFSSKACEILSLANVFHPRNLNDVGVESARKLAKIYGFDSETVVLQFALFSKSSEIDSWKKEYQEWMKLKEKALGESSAKKPETWLCLPTLLKVFSKNHLDKLYPELYELVKVVATLPVTVASCERAHSKVKIINNYLRASMSDERLENLVLISIERDIADKIELDSLLETFKLAKNRKLPL